MTSTGGRSSADDNASHSGFSVRSWVERVFVLLVGAVISASVLETRKIMEVMDDGIDMEEMNAPGSKPWFTPFLDLVRDRKLKETAVTREMLHERAEASGTIKPFDMNNLGIGPVGNGRMNIVLFYADDWTMKVLGKLNPNVRTPNIDKMADNGMLFLNNCVTTSICWQSRATLMTGTYYARHQHALPFTETMFETHDWNQTVFPKLREAGYHTALFGKWHALQPSKYIDKAFDRKKFYYGKHWEQEHVDGVPVMRHVTDKNRWDAIDFLKNRPKHKNFALKVSFFATHAEDNNIPSYKPMNWTRMGIYPDNNTEPYYQNIVPPKTATEQHWKDLPYFFSSQNAGRLRWRERWEPHCWQKNIRDLYAMATEVDWAIGEIIDVLKMQGVYDETILIFTTDNGDMHGEHGLAEKWYPMEESINVPLVIQDPRMPAKYRGTTNEDWTLNVDLAPTILGAAGLEPASFMQGRDIAQLYLANETATQSDSKWKDNIRQYDTKEARKPWRTEWFYEWNMGDPINATGHAQNGFIDAAFALVTHEWKYIYWPLKVYEQLFHRSVDKFDEYDILQNYYLHKEKIEKNEWIDQNERRRMETFTPKNTTPYGDSVESTKEIYETMKAKYHALKKHVQSGGKI